MEKFVLDSPALEEAVKLRSPTNYPSRRPGRSSLKEVPATGVGEVAYNGMFAVTDNGDGTATVNGGAVMVRFNDFPVWIDGKILPFAINSSAIALIAKREGVRDPWQIELVSCDNNKLPGLYIPGTQMYMEIAGGVVREGYGIFAQYWQGGMIRFCDRYYVE